MKTYMVNELDVYKEMDSYTINDVMRDCARIELENPYNVREVLSKTRKAGYNLAKGRYTTNINDFCEPTIFEIINRKTGEYILQLELVEE